MDRLNASSMLCLPPYYMVNERKQQAVTAAAAPTCSSSTNNRLITMQHQQSLPISSKRSYYSNTNRSMSSSSFKRFYIEENETDVDDVDDETNEEIDTPLATPTDEECLTFNHDKNYKDTTTIQTKGRLKRCDFKHIQLNQWFSSYFV